MTANQVLIIEDDKKTADLVSMYLEKEGYQTLIALDGQEGLDLFREHSPAFIVLDLMLPKIDGWDVCREIRKESEVPILMLTAREEEMDRVSGLTMGADDYLVKPFSPRELVARIKAILRRSQSANVPVLNLHYQDLSVDIKKHRVTLDGHLITLTPHEFTLLTTLMKEPGRVFTRAELLEQLYPSGEAVVIDRVVDVHIGKLRQKIEKDPASPIYVRTLRGVGYSFIDYVEDRAEA